MACATCPAAISFFFKAFMPEITRSNRVSDHKSFGSLGVGSTTDKTVETKVKRAKVQKIVFNGKKIRLPTVETALKKISKQKLSISIKSELPLGCGFGISGAATLSAIYAANKLLNLKLAKQTLAEIAHFAEIKEKTGLGTVATQITGGFLIKTKSGIPPVYKRLNFTGEKIYATVIGKLPTAKILADKNKIELINKAAEAAFKEIKKTDKLTLSEIINISYKFCRQSGILKSDKVKNIIGQIKDSKGKATMAILGETVLSNIKPKQVKYPVFELKVSNDKIKI